ncbi:MAG: ABC transporter ATP-binding protein, partial [Sedimenticola sp.]
AEKKQVLKAANKPAGESAAKPKKLSYKDQRELDALPQRLEQLEKGVDQLQAAMADPAFYQKTPDKMALANDQLQSLESELAMAYERWEELEALL